eukprot:TRINITY_DN12556_c0_g1_i1.p1 TRINITY_DN12556_c0_g1~~TRINITY_DN12556_c0_g1_i1.p1  ORF type:complete len:324 (+),score=99.13 TRINITY_DN12556_c0_g1_i1:93-1064(+)
MKLPSSLLLFSLFLVLCFEPIKSQTSSLLLFGKVLSKKGNTITTTVYTLNTQKPNSKPNPLITYNATLVNPDGQAIGITLVPSSDFLYWSDSGSNQIHSCQISNCPATLKVVVSGLNEPQGMVASKEGLYFIDSGDVYGTGETTIQYFDFSNQKQIILLTSNNHSFDQSGIPRSVALGNKGLYVGADNGVYFLNLSNPPPFKLQQLLSGVPNQTDPLIAEGIKMFNNQIYFSRFYGGIYSAALDGTKVSQFANSKYVTFSVDIDAKKGELYFMGMEGIGVASLSPPHSQKLICNECGNNVGIVLYTSTSISNQEREMRVIDSF